MVELGGEPTITFNGSFLKFGDTRDHHYQVTCLSECPYNLRRAASEYVTIGELSDQSSRDSKDWQTHSAIIINCLAVSRNLIPDIKMTGSSSGSCTINSQSSQS